MDNNMKKEEIKQIYDSKFIKLYEYEFGKDGHYYWASRRDKDRLVAPLDDEASKNMQADAVSCFVVLNIKGQPKKLLLNWEYRYPAGRYLLSVPAGVIDPEDRNNPNALYVTAARELYEETGISLQDGDEIKVVNPCVYSTPGMTDESNALVYICVNRDEMPEMNHGHSSGSEKFEGFRLVDQEEAMEFIVNGVDERGMFYPLFTWAALMFFVGLK